MARAAPANNFVNPYTLKNTAHASTIIDEVSSNAGKYFDLIAGQYIELVFASADDTAKVFTVPASSSPYVRPLIPSTYVTINQLS